MGTGLRTVPMGRADYRRLWKRCARVFGEFIAPRPPLARLPSMNADSVAPFPRLRRAAAGFVLVAVLLAGTPGGQLAARGSSVEYFWIPGAPDRVAGQLKALADDLSVRMFDGDGVLVEIQSHAVDVVAQHVPNLERLTGPLVDVELVAVTGGRLPEHGTPVREVDGAWFVAVPQAHGRQASYHDHTGDHAACLHSVPRPARYDLTALQLHTAAELAHPYRRSRLAEGAAAHRAGQVSTANIEATVRLLAESAPGVARSRYAGHADFATVAEDLRAVLEAVFDGAADSVVSHTLEVQVDGQPVTFENLIARRPGRTPGTGTYILGAHYDAVASNTGDWDWQLDAAPGADDNASGVACVIEAARVLLQQEYAFDIEVMLFTTEERFGPFPGLLGSRVLVEELGYGTHNVLGMVAADMVGFRADSSDSLTIFTNPRSAWLGEQFEEAVGVVGAAHAPEAVNHLVRPTFNRSDHGAFWEVGADALLLIESANVDATNPQYHRVTDRLESLTSTEGFDRIRRTAELIVAVVGQYAAPVAGVSSLGELTFSAEAGGAVSFARVGQEVIIGARLLNEGAPLANARVVGRMEVSHDRDAGGGQAAPEPVAVDVTFPAWETGEWKAIAIPWVPNAEQFGLQRVVVDLVADSQGSTLGRFGFANSIRVLGLDLAITDAHVRPNPVAGGASAGTASFQIAERGDVAFRVLDALGREVGRGSGFFDVGRVNVPLATLVPADLPSGVYLLQIAADGSRFALGQADAQVRFALER